MKRKRVVEEFSAFVHETGGQLHRAALLLTGDHHLAEDLTQITYAKTFASWSRVTAADSPLAYARTTLLNTYLSHRRLRRNSELPADSSLFSHQEEAGIDSAARLDVLVALGTLSSLDRAVVVLRYWEDRSVADTAIELGFTPEAVRTRSRRALQRLRPLLEDDCNAIERTTP